MIAGNSQESRGEFRASLSSFEQMQGMAWRTTASGTPPFAGTSMRRPSKTTARTWTLWSSCTGISHDPNKQFVAGWGIRGHRATDMCDCIYDAGDMAGRSCDRVDILTDQRDSKSRLCGREEWTECQGEQHGDDDDNDDDDQCVYVLRPEGGCLLRFKQSSDISKRHAMLCYAMLPYTILDYAIDRPRSTSLRQSRCFRWMSSGRVKHETAPAHDDWLQSRKKKKTLQSILFKQEKKHSNKRKQTLTARCPSQAHQTCAPPPSSISLVATLPPSAAASTP